MRSSRPSESAIRWFRPSPQFVKFLTTPGATILAAVMTFGAVAGTGLAIWRGHWVDAVVYALFAVVFAGWLGINLLRRHGGPSHGRQ